MNKFLKFISPDKYEDYLRKGVYKYVPRRIIYKFQQKINPKIICNYIRKDINQIIGYGVGAFVNKDILTRDQYVDRIIQTICMLKEQEEYKNLKHLYIDNLGLVYDEIDIIKRSTSIDVADGKQYFLDSLIKLIEEICKVKGKNIQDQEILILSDDTEDTKDISIKISSIIKFLTIYSHDNKFSEDLEQRILKKTGLSPNIIKNKDKLIEKFDFIINIPVDTDINLNKLKRTATVIDTSKNKVISNNYSKRKNILIIDDVLFKNDGSIVCDVKEYELDKEISTSTSKLFGNTNKDIVKIKIYDKIYSVKDGVNLYNFQSSNISSFHKV